MIPEEKLKRLAEGKKKKKKNRWKGKKTGRGKGDPTKTNETKIQGFVRRTGCRLRTMGTKGGGV